MQIKIDYVHDPRAIVKSFADGAKGLWVLALVMKGGAAALGISFLLTGNKSAAVPWLLAVIAACSELAQWRSDVLKGRAEQLKRKIEFSDGIGWPLSPADISDYLARISSKGRRGIELTLREDYFSSTAEKGPRRALENLQESSWWSKHLAGWMAVAVAVVAVVLVCGSLLALVLSIAAATSLDDVQATSRTISALLSLVVSLGTIKLLSGYLAFSQKAEQVEGTTKVLMAGQVDGLETEVTKLTHEYQIARASAPLIPNLLWERKREGLQKLWDQYRKGG